MELYNILLEQDLLQNPSQQHRTLLPFGKQLQVVRRESVRKIF